MPTWNDNNRELPNQIVVGHKKLGEIEEVGQHSDFVEEMPQKPAHLDNGEYSGNFMV